MQLYTLFVACKNVNLSAGWCFSVHSCRGVVNGLYVDPFASKPISIPDTNTTNAPLKGKYDFHNPGLFSSCHHVHT